MPRHLALRRQFSLRTALLVVACCSFSLWFARGTSLRQHEAARALGRNGIHIVMDRERSSQTTISNLLLGDRRYDAVTAIFVSDVLLSEQDVRHFAAFPNLRLCGFDRCPSTAQALCIIGENTNVEAINIDNARIGLEDIACLHKLPNLKYLELADTTLIGHSFPSFSRIPQLERITFSGTIVVDGDLNDIGSCRKLEALAFTDVALSEDTLRAVSNLKSLRYLMIRRSTLPAGGLNGLVGLPQLEHIDLSGSSIEDSDLKALGRLSNLKVAQLSSTRVTDQAVATLRHSLPNCNVISDTN